MGENAKKSYIAGLNWYKKGDFQKSAACFSEAITSGIEDNDIYLYRSICRIHLNEFTGALSDLDHLIGLHPDIPEYRFRRGFVRYKLNRFSDAIDDFFAIPDTDEQFSIRWHYCYVCLYKDGKYDLALRASEKALEFFCTISKIWFNTGVILSALDREEQAELAFQVAQKLQPQLAQAPRTIME